MHLSQPAVLHHTEVVQARVMNVAEIRHQQVLQQHQFVEQRNLLIASSNHDYIVVELERKNQMILEVVRIEAERRHEEGMMKAAQENEMILRQVARANDEHRIRMEAEFNEVFAFRMHQVTTEASAQLELERARINAEAKESARVSQLELAVQNAALQRRNEELASRLMDSGKKPSFESLPEVEDKVKRDPVFYIGTPPQSDSQASTAASDPVGYGAVKNQRISHGYRSGPTDNPPLQAATQALVLRAASTATGTVGDYITCAVPLYTGILPWLCTAVFRPRCLRCWVG
jgi:hypothetical protein